MFLAGLMNAFFTASLAQQKPQFLPLQPHKLQIAQATMQKALAQKDSNLLAEAYYLYGKLYAPSGDFYTAKKYFLQSLRIVEKRGYSEKLARLYDHLAFTALLTENYHETQKYWNLEERVAQTLQTPRALMRSYGGYFKFYQKDWSLVAPNLPKANRDSAWHYLNKLERLIPFTTDTLDILSTYHGFAEELNTRKNYQKAIFYSQKGLTLSRQKKNFPHECYFLYRLGHICAVRGRLSESWAYLKQAEKLLATLPGNSQNIRDFAIRSAEGFQAYYTAKADWRKAYQYQAKLHELRLQEVFTERTGALNRLSMEYDNEKKELLLKSQRQQLRVSQASLQKQQIYTAVLAVLLLVVVGIGALLFYLYRQNKQLALRNAILVHEQNHRVKNNLQTIVSMLYLQSARLPDDTGKQLIDTTQRRVEVMTYLQRHLYDRSEYDTILLHEYLSEIVEAAIDSFGYTNVDSHLDILTDLSLSSEQALSVGFIVHELVVNACKYAFHSTSTPTLRIRAAKAEGKCEVQVSDNGPGLDETQTNQSSFGLRLIALQVRQLRGTYRLWNDDGVHFSMQFKD